MTPKLASVEADWQVRQRRRDDGRTRRKDCVRMTWIRPRQDNLTPGSPHSLFSKTVSDRRAVFCFLLVGVIEVAGDLVAGSWVHFCPAFGAFYWLLVFDLCGCDDFSIRESAEWHSVFPVVGLARYGGLSSCTVGWL